MIVLKKIKRFIKKNLLKFQDSHKNRQVTVVEKSFQEYSKMPLKSDIVGRFKYFSSDVKDKRQRISLVFEEIISLWKEKLNFPCQTEQSVKRKLDDVIKKYESLRKKGKADLLQQEIFDVTNKNGIWLSSEDKRLYELQLQTIGRIGYTTSKLAEKNTIHPSILQKISNQPSTSKGISSVCESSSKETERSSPELEENDEEFHTDDYESSEEEYNMTKRPRKYSSCKMATNLVIYNKVSINKASNVVKKMSEEGVKVPTPSQSGIHKSLYKEAKKYKEILIKELRKENWSLHFDGKNIDKWEYQVVVLKNERSEIKLCALQLVDGKSTTIFDALVNSIDEFQLWNSIKMIVTDTTNVDTGKKWCCCKTAENFSGKRIFNTSICCMPTTHLR